MLNTVIDCFIYYKMPNVKVPEEKHFPPAEDLVDLFTSQFVDVPFNAEKYWVGVSDGTTTSILPIGYIDITSYGNTASGARFDLLLHKWVTNNFAIPDMYTIQQHPVKGTVLNHKRIF